MKPDVTCPHCEQPLTAAVLRRLWAFYTSTLRKKRSGGHNGGRPKNADNRSIIGFSRGDEHEKVA